MKPKRYSIKAFRADLLGIQRQLIEAHGGHARYQILLRVFTLLGQPEHARRVLVNHADNYPRGFQVDNLALTIGYGLACAEGDLWRRQRKLAQPAFDKALLMRVMEVTATLGQDTIAEWQQAEAPIDVFHDMQMLTMRVIGMALFNLDLKHTPNHFADMARIALELAIVRNLSPIILPMWLPTPLHRKHKRLRAQVDVFVQEQIDKRLVDNSDQSDILGKLIAEYGDSASEYRDELRDQVATLFFAGFETTATAVSWTWYLLSQHPEAEAKLYDEITTVLGDRLPNYDDLDALVYTDYVIKEAMRLYPPIYSLSRTAVADDDAMQGCPIHQGDNVLLPLHHLHRDAAYWDDADAFRPERFAVLTEEQRRAYMPFGAGKHKCIGVHFATVEMVVVIAMIMQRFRLQLVDGHPVVPEPAIAIYPKHGLLMHAIPRS